MSGLSGSETVEKVSDAPKTQRPRRSKVLNWGLELVIIVVGALILSALIRNFVVQMFIIPSESMENTLAPGDRVIVTKFGGFQRGDIVVFEDPGGWMTQQPEPRSPAGQVLEFIGLLPSSATNHLIKRVVGMPGDRVSCCDEAGRLSVNGHALDESSYLFIDPQGVQVAPASVPFDVTVPKDRIFVLGDHRNASGDSRCRLNDLSQEGKGMAAFVPTEKVVGATTAIVSPLDRLRYFSIPEAFKSVPAPGSPAPDAPILTVVNPGC